MSTSGLNSTRARRATEDRRAEQVKLNLSALDLELTARTQNCECSPRLVKQEKLNYSHSSYFRISTHLQSTSKSQRD